MKKTTNPNFNYIISNYGRSYEREFAYLIDHIDEIIQLGLKINTHLQHNK